MRLFGWHLPSSQAVSRRIFNAKLISSIALLAARDRPATEFARRHFASPY
jgi:hypothetical protein